METRSFSLKSKACAVRGHFSINLAMSERQGLIARIERDETKCRSESSAGKLHDALDDNGVVDVVMRARTSGISGDQGKPDRSAPPNCFEHSAPATPPQRGAAALLLGSAILNIIGII
ncbi:hypothetical protein ASG68_11945 [Rhizobium sp. Leaf453]|nr:hypothetical protein ASG68_11945 [Rhizobium sp. Leaf453]